MEPRERVLSSASRTAVTEIYMQSTLRNTHSYQIIKGFECKICCGSNNNRLYDLRAHYDRLLEQIYSRRRRKPCDNADR